MRKHVRISVGALAFVAQLLLMPTVAHGGEETDQQKKSRALSDEGQQKYDIEDYDQAIEYFKLAYDAYPYPNLLFNIAQCYRYKRDHERAIRYYHKYLQAKPDAKDREKVEAIIRSIEQSAAEQKASDAKPPTGVQGPELPATGAPPSSAPSVSVTPVAVPRPDPTSMPEPPEWWRDRWGWALLGSGLLACGAGTGYLVHGSSLEDKANAPDTDQLLVEGLFDDASKARHVGMAFLGIGAAVSAVGIIKLAIGEDPVPRKTRTEVSFGPGWVTLSGHF